MAKKHIVVTGLGVVSPLGNSVDTFWANIKAGVCGIGPLTKFNPERLNVKVAAEVKDFDITKYMPLKDSRRLGLFSQYAVAAAVDAWEDAGLTDAGCDPARVGVILGVGVGGKDADEEGYKTLFDRGPARLGPMVIPKIIPNECAGNVSIALNAKGPVLAVVTACSASTDAIGVALDMIRAGRADVVIAGGTEAAITEYCVGGFQAMHALSLNPDPATACRPFDKDRNGFVMGEGSAILIMESEEHAKSRGAKIYGEVAGYGAGADAYHVCAPDPEAVGIILAEKMAIADAGIAPSEVDYINAHGTSTGLNDPMETKAAKAVFGEHAYKLKMSSSKSMTGHLLGATGALEAMICLLAMRDSFYPPTINYNTPDPDCDLDYVPNQGVSGSIKVSMSNTLGFGGHNSSLILKAVQD